MHKDYVYDELGLVSLVLTGSPSASLALEKICEHFETMVVRLACRYAWDSDSRDELAQEGRLAVVASIPRFDVRRGVRLGALIYQRIQGRHLHCRRGKQKALSLVSPSTDGRVRSLDASVDSKDEGEMTLHEVVAADQDAPHQVDVSLIGDLVQRVLLTLARRQIEALQLRFFEDLPPSEVARRLGVSRPRVSDLLQGDLANLWGTLAFAA